MSFFSRKHKTVKEKKLTGSMDPCHFCFFFLNCGQQTDTLIFDLEFGRGQERSAVMTKQRTSLEDRHGRSGHQTGRWTHGHRRGSQTRSRFARLGRAVESVLQYSRCSRQTQTLGSSKTIVQFGISLTICFVISSVVYVQLMVVGSAAT